MPFINYGLAMIPYFRIVYIVQDMTEIASMLETVTIPGTQQGYASRKQTYVGRVSLIPFITRSNWQAQPPALPSSGQPPDPATSISTIGKILCRIVVYGYWFYSTVPKEEVYNQLSPRIEMDVLRTRKISWRGWRLQPKDEFRVYGGF